MTFETTAKGRPDTMAVAVPAFPAAVSRSRIRAYLNRSALAQIEVGLGNTDAALDWLARMNLPHLD